MAKITRTSLINKLSYNPETGVFRNKYKAHDVYLTAAKKYFGEYARAA